MSEVPTATYRLQLRKEFGFAAAASVADYLAELGVSHVYLSPVLTAAPGSSHGYDVVDHSRINPELGGEEGFRAMAARLREAGLGIVIDVVPNHMDIGGAAVRDVAEHGRTAAHAHWFDVDWDRPDARGRLLLPGLDGSPNYRRFFDISSLIGLRVEDDEVFAATHAVPLRLLEEGLVDGLRIDHPDGLADPAAYLRGLGGWVVVEKILSGEERLPVDWNCAGTTGYDALRVVGGLFRDPAGEGPLTELYVALTGGPAEFAPVALAGKRHVAENSLKPEVDRLFALLRQDRPGDDPDRLRADMLDRLVSSRVYRTYETSPEYVVRFEQTTAPLVAKGIEDTAFYRWSRFAALNEVGGEPGAFATSVADFHAHCAFIAEDWPATMTTLSTHDTKRGEDVRARLAVLTELPGEWAGVLAAWAGGIDADIDYLMWQTIVGAWPIDEDRLGEYLTKAMREAKTHTAWVDGDPAYEASVLERAKIALVEHGADVAAFLERLAPHIRANVLGQKLVQLTMPGVPDVYQGCELVSLSLVDPDNRRPVDYDRRRRLLADGPVEGLADGPEGLLAGLDRLDREKIHLTAQTLRLRRAHPEWFAAGYHPLRAAGPAADHVLAFRRGGAITVATRLPVGAERLGWEGTTLPLPPGEWLDVLSDDAGMGAVGGEMPVAGILADRPVALLVAAP